MNIKLQREFFELNTAVASLGYGLSDQHDEEIILHVFSVSNKTFITIKP